MITPLQPPWSGLATLAPRLDLWPLVRALGGPAKAAHAPPSAWAAVGLPLPHLGLLAPPPWRAHGIDITSPRWPASLVDLPLGPVALAAEGEVALLGRPMVAIVGTRTCTSYGREWAARLAGAVASAGAVVVSGLAHGIDAAAHEAAGDATVAVLGQGMSAGMPRWQAALRERLLARGGLVLSELPPDARGDRWTFPVRNRIVAGLARVVVVVEAGHRSGAKNTVWHALRYGRDVLAVPGPLGAEASAGCLDLIDQGAAVVRGPSSVLDAAGLTAPRGGPPGGTTGDRVLTAVREGASVEAIVQATGLSLADALGALGELELHGRVVRLPGRRYVPAPS